MLHYVMYVISLVINKKKLYVLCVFLIMVGRDLHKHIYVWWQIKGNVIQVYCCVQKNTISVKCSSQQTVACSNKKIVIISRVQLSWNLIIESLHYVTVCSEQQSVDCSMQQSMRLQTSGKCSHQQTAKNVSYIHEDLGT